MLDLMVPGIFIFGACFVWLSCKRALQTAIDVMRIADLEMEAFTDPLTSVYNRRFMEQYLHEEVAKVKRYGFDLSIMLLDIDHFKQINDQFGHQAGDEVLIEITSIVSQELRDSDILARYGGEEFIIIAPNTNSANAEGFANRLLKRVNSHSFRLNP
jgi:diguanylate cyclase (GGDEF)-like protein